jgi:hypothetical protein
MMKTSATLRSDRKPIRFREAERRPVAMGGYVRAPGLDVDVAVSDLSYDGCRLACAEPLQQGLAVDLLVRRKGKAKAQIVWSKGNHAGLTFVGD